ncbi:Protein PIH1D3-like [Oopsacas minuta]|uniref:Protein PIH1D3-like n=1 Tax=Oopsacas minuta TaxID=111878 RepID=A0AAV7KFM0_9METZ|nr:Protein PIH1D3-like [Oopsacas minuta]
METDCLLKLSALLNPPEDESCETKTSPFTPASIGAPAVKQIQECDPISEPSKDIWNKSEVDNIVPYTDPRPSPEYDMKFLQAVNTEDVFLGMGKKNPGTASCESMILRVKLPNAKSSDIQLNIKETLLLLTTPKYYLSLNLPDPVDDKMTRAQWDIDTDTLILTFKLKRIYDFLNF